MFNWASLLMASMGEVSVSMTALTDDGQETEEAMELLGGDWSDATMLTPVWAQAWNRAVVSLENSDMRFRQLVSPALSNPELPVRNLSKDGDDNDDWRDAARLRLRLLVDAMLDDPQLEKDLRLEISTNLNRETRFQDLLASRAHQHDLSWSVDGVDV